MEQPTQQFVQSQWFYPTFALMWIAITGLLAQLGGWSTLARQFRSDESIQGERFRFVSGSMGKRFLPVSYGNCLFVVINDAGFGLSILFPFRILSPPLFIPWHAVASVERKKLLFLFPYTLIRIGGEWPTISIRGHAGRYLENAYAKAYVCRAP